MKRLIFIIALLIAHTLFVFFISPSIALTSNEYIMQARRHVERGEYEEAITGYSQAIALDPGNITLYISRAEAFEKNRQPERAVEDYNTVIAVEPGLLPVFQTQYDLLKKKILENSEEMQQ